MGMLSARELSKKLSASIQIAHVLKGKDNVSIILLIYVFNIKHIDIIN